MSWVIIFILFVSFAIVVTFLPIKWRFLFRDFETEAKDETLDHLYPAGLMSQSKLLRFMAYLVLIFVIGWSIGLVFISVGDIIDGDYGTRRHGPFKTIGVVIIAAVSAAFFLRKN